MVAVVTLVLLGHVPDRSRMNENNWIEETDGNNRLGTLVPPDCGGIRPTSNLPFLELCLTPLSFPQRAVVLAYG